MSRTSPGVLQCDHPGCVSGVGSTDGLTAARRFGRTVGWSFDEQGDWCADHGTAAEPPSGGGTEQ